MTIHEAQAWYDVYGTIVVVDGDAMAITIYDDETDCQAGYMIDQYDID